MKAKLILRGLLGFPLGITVGHCISILTSLIWAGGYYSPCAPELIAMMGNEINAVLLQTFLCGLVGAGYMAGSVIWEMERWSIAKQTGLYFLLASIIMLPAAYFSYWMEHSILGFAVYFGIFVLIFLIYWLVFFFIWKYRVSRMNASLRNKSEPRP